MESSEQIYSSIKQSVHDGHLAAVKELINLHGVSTPESGYNLLCIAIEENHAEICKFLLESGCKVNLESTDETPTNTPLHYAVAIDNPEIVLMLLECSPDISAKGLNGQTPLHAAIENNKFDLVKLLIKLGANIEAKNDSKETPLLVAVANNNYLISKYLTDKKAYVNAQRIDEKTALHIAIENNNFPLFAWIWENFGNVDIQDKKGRTPLHLAVSKRLLEFAKLILNFYASIDVRDNKGHTVLHIALLNKDWDMVLLLVNKRANVCVKDKLGRTALHLAVEKGKYSVVKHILKKGKGARVAIESECKLGLTPLDVAVKYKKERIAKLLKRCGAKVSCQISDAKTSLLLAVESGLVVLINKALKDNPDMRKKGNRLAFYTALKSQNAKIIDKLKQYGFGVTTEDVTDDEIIRYAIESGSEYIIQLLLNNGFDPKASVLSADGKAVTPLHLSAMYKQEKIAKLLLDHGVDLNAKDADGKPAIYYSSDLMDMANLRLFLQYNADITDAPDALKMAIRNDAIDIVEILLTKDVDINAPGGIGNTPLHWTAVGQSDETGAAIAELLLSKGAKLNSCEIPQYSTDDEELKYCNDGASVLHRAVGSGYVKLTETLLQHNPDLNIRNTFSETVLHVSAREGDTIITEILLKHGADLEAKTLFGFTPLHMAIEFNRRDVVKILLNAGSNIEARDNNGRTPLAIIATMKTLKGANVKAIFDSFFKRDVEKERNNNIPSVINQLLSKGADLNCIDNEGKTLLHIASEYGFPDFVKFLLNNAADINSKDLKGKTPLALAAEKGHDAIVALLLKSKANSRAKDNRGKSALHLACAKRGNTKVLAELLKYGRNIDCKDNRGKTPLQIALRKGNASIVTQLLKNGANVNVMGDVIRKAIDCVMDENYIQVFNFLIWRGIPEDTEDEENDEEKELFGVRSLLLDRSIVYIQRHVFMMRSVGMQLCEQLLFDPVEDVAEYKRKCKKELFKLKITKIGDTKMTYLTFLRKTVQELVKVPKRKKIWRVLKRGDYENLFPRFSSLICCHFRQWTNRENSIQIVKSTGGEMFQGLTDEIIDLVVSFLSNDELYELTCCLGEIFKNN